jgi:uncharacterized membrane protein HdeD (DUF308 family)
MDVETLERMGFERGMLRSLARHWWLLLLRGVAAVAFGLMAVIWPDLTLRVLITLFGAYTVVDGAIEIWSGIQNRNVHDRWWVDILIGVAGIVAGVLVIALPDLSALALMYFIAAWMVVTGVLEIVYAIRLREEIANEWLLGLAGILSVLLGVFFFAFPGDGAISLVWLIGFYAILFGVLLVIVAFRVRRMGDRLG